MLYKNIFSTQIQMIFEIFTKEENNIYLNISSKTWDKGVKGLFDYSSKDITEFKTAINDNKIYFVKIKK